MQTELKKRKTRGCSRKTEIRREFERYTENICTLVVVAVRDRNYVCTGARSRWQNPCVEREREIQGEERRQSIYVRTWQNERQAEGERTRRMQGSSVRRSVVAMGIGGEGYGGTRGKGRSMQTHHKVLWLSRTVPI